MAQADMFSCLQAGAYEPNQSRGEGQGVEELDKAEVGGEWISSTLSLDKYKAKERVPLFKDNPLPLAFNSSNLLSMFWFQLQEANIWF